MASPSLASATALALTGTTMRSAVIRQDRDRDDERADEAAFGANRGVSHFTFVDGRDPLRRAVVGILSNVASELRAIDIHPQEHGLFSTRQEAKLVRGKHRLPAEFASARGGKCAQLQFHVALTPGVIVKDEWNDACFTAARVLDDVRVPNATGAMAIRFRVATAAMLIAFSRRHPALHRFHDRLHRLESILIHVGVALANTLEVVGIIHHAHPAAIRGVAVKNCRSARHRVLVGICGHVWFLGYSDFFFVPSERGLVAEAVSSGVRGSTLNLSFPL